MLWCFLALGILASQGLSDMNDLFMNSALGEYLARSIFATVSSCKSPGACLLESMEISMYIPAHARELWGSSIKYQLADILFGIGRSWQLA